MDTVKRCRENEQPWCEHFDRNYNINNGIIKSEIRVESRTGCEYEGKKGISGGVSQIQEKQCSPAEIDTIEEEIEEIKADPKARKAGKKVNNAIDGFEKAKTVVGATGFIAGTVAGEPVTAQKSLDLLL